MNQTKPYRILLINAGYCTGINGTARSYAQKSYRYVRCPKKAESRALADLQRLIRRHQPDVACIVEIKKQQAEQLVNAHYPFLDAEVKYGAKSVLRKMPLTKNNCNAILTHQPCAVRKIFLSSGTKKLVHLLSLPNDTMLALCHCSLGKRSRRKQVREISWLMNKKKSIVCGDFNARKPRELGAFLDGLRHVPTTPTFPAARPRWALDGVFCTPDVHATAQVVPNEFSDHRAVVVDVRL